MVALDVFPVDGSISMPKNGPQFPHAKVTDTGFILDVGANQATRSTRWDDIVEIVAYKRDQWAYDISLTWNRRFYRGSRGLSWLRRIHQGSRVTICALRQLVDQRCVSTVRD